MTAEPDRVIEDLFREAHELSLKGKLDESAERYKKIIRKTGRRKLTILQSEAMRKLGSLLWRKAETSKAMDYYRRSILLSKKSGDDAGCAKAYNGIGSLYFNSGKWDKVEKYYTLALEAGSTNEDPNLIANIYNNLGAMNNILGDWKMAIQHYEKAVDIYETIKDDRGLARTYNNLGLTYRDKGDWHKASSYYRECIRLSEEVDDVSLKSNCALNEAQVLIKLSRLEDARALCEEAYEILSDIGEVGGRAEAMMLYGVIYSKMNKLALAENHFTESLKINKAHGNLLGMAECYREMAVLYKDWGKNKKTLGCLGKAFKTFRTLKASHYLDDIDTKIVDLEELTFKITRDMGTAVESKDTYTFGHSQRVAHYAIEIVKKMKQDKEMVKGLMIAAYLHDLGKVKVTKKILQKPRKLTVKEFSIIQQHPDWGIKMLEGIDFPWEVKPLVRSHQEKWDGSGYPDGLAGEDIPLGARIIAVADVFDALTTERPYRPALPLKEALKILKDEAGKGLDPVIVKKFLRLVKANLPADLKDSLSAMPMSSFLKLWGGNSTGRISKENNQREANLTSLVRAG